jgi:hypothetical protein
VPYYKVNLFFQQDQAGWSETYYTQSGSNEGAYSAMLPFFVARLAILASPATLVAVRISDDAIYKDASLFPLINPVQFPSQYLADVPWNAQLIRLQSLDLYWRQLYLRGIPDAVYGGAGSSDTLFPALWQGALNRFVSACMTGNLILIKVAQKPTGGLPLIRNWVANDTLTTTVTSYTPHGLNPGDTVQFYYIRGLLVPPGRQVVLSTPDSFTFTVNYATSSAFHYRQGGKYKKVVPLYTPVDYAVAERVVHRIVGRPFGQQRGRRRSIARSAL